MIAKVNYRKFVIFSLIGVSFLFVGVLNDLLLNSMVEIFNIVVCFIVFYTAKNSNSETKNNYLMLLGISFSFIGMLNAINFVSFYVFDGNGNCYFQMRLIIRYLIVLSLFLSFWLMNKRINTYIFFSFYLLLFAILLSLVFVFKIFPKCYNSSVTYFDIINNFIILFLFVLLLPFVFKNKESFLNKIYLYFIFMVIFFIISNVLWIFNFKLNKLLHNSALIFDFFAMYFIYKVVSYIGIKHPHKQLKEEIENRIIAEEELRNSEERYRLIVETANEGICLIDNNYNIIFINKRLAEMFGYPMEEIVGRSLISFMDNDLKEDFEKHMEKGREGEKEIFDFRFIKKDNSPIWTLFSGNPFFDENNQFECELGMLTDITERKEIEVELKDLLSKKEDFIKELHHRVKNNLTIINSIINMQDRNHKDDKMRRVLNDIKIKIKTIAAIYDKLYKSSDLTSINLNLYIRGVSEYVINYFNSEHKISKVVFEIENIFCDIDKALSCGLIITELLTNSFKFAFINNNNPQIRIKCYKENTKIVLMINDNGPGFPEDFDCNNVETLGIKLVTSLVMQISGDIFFVNNNGAEVKILF